ncbi:ubiquitin-like protein Pup [Arcanobacterium buesumense]|uniref:Prokaryotic ubiquitin-like protein Pup n=1 Tax=Arcanobacterium buesumense TaxID=2722751 RepID=A0A6H2ELA1_9ACTO|nr:ubiquitin-like protein Pup [Arcanobacterium buesumense]QJC21811.1 ubiquitin-like protein Pup [Arcanobacterium buesumense]
MSEQEFFKPVIHTETDDEIITTERSTPFDVDDLLDDIDTILETNASSFVQGFVQKGGQ